MCKRDVFNWGGWVCKWVCLIMEGGCANGGAGVGVVVQMGRVGV